MFKRKYSKKIKILIYIFLAIEMCILFLMYKSHSNEIIKLDDVKLKEVDDSKTTFIILLEQEDGTFQESEDNVWPTSGYVYNEEKSECLDYNNQRIEEILVYDKINNIATLESGEVKNCNIYFNLNR